MDQSLHRCTIRSPCELHANYSAWKFLTVHSHAVGHFNNSFVCVRVPLCLCVRARVHYLCVTGSCEHMDVDAGDPNPDLQEQQAFLTDEPYLQPRQLLFFCS